MFTSAVSEYLSVSFSFGADSLINVATPQLKRWLSSVREKQTIRTSRFKYTYCSRTLDDAFARKSVKLVDRQEGRPKGGLLL